MPVATCLVRDPEGGLDSLPASGMHAISELRQREAEAQADLDAEMRGRGMAYGMRMAAELVAAVVVGCVIGWGLDWALGTKPWLFLLFFLLGFAAGVLNVMRSYERMQRDFTARTGGNIGRSVPDDDD